MVHHRHSVKIIEKCAISPPPGSVPSTTLPLTFFDIPWLHGTPVQRIFFYEFPQPTHIFLQNVLPTLKHSLSLTLKHFFPFASNLVFPPQPHSPYILHSDGDSVSFTVAESTKDFHDFVSDTPRDVRDSHPFIPDLPSARASQDGTKLFPLMAIQVTVLPNYGFSICIAFRHVAADGRAFHHFMKFWASVCRTKGSIDCSLEAEGSLLLPLHNRGIIEDPKGFKLILLEKLWSSSLKPVEFVKGNVLDVVTDKVRSTFVLSRDHVEKIKKWVSFKCKNNGVESLHISTFVVTCSLMWVCKVKSQDTNVNIVSDDDEIHELVFIADCRNRQELSIPTTYFGNCLVWRVVELKRSKLVGENGIVEAAIAIESKVRDFQCEALKGVENMMPDFKHVEKLGECLLTVAGYPKLGIYETDFGWGKPKKSEVLHIESSRSISLSDSRDNEGAVEVGLTLVKNQMDNFNIILKEHLRNICCRSD